MVSVLRSCLVKHLDIRRGEMAVPSKKRTISSCVSRGENISRTTVGEGILVVDCKIWYVDVVVTIVAPKCRTVFGATVHSFLRVLVLRQFDRIISIDIVERENKCLGCGRVAA